MAVQKRSVSLEEEVARGVERAATEDGVSVSAWLSQAAADRLRVREGLRGVAAWEREAGSLSREEIAAGEVLLNRLLSARTPAKVSSARVARSTRRRSA